jgi:signal peptidase II
LNNTYIKYFGLSAFILGLDQLTKMLVHFYMDYGIQGQIILMGDWLKLHYTLNPGMAFGMELGGENGKLILTSFRILAMGGIAYYLIYLIKKKMPAGYITCIALILGGAVGNLFDSVFYGVLLNNAPAGSPSPWLHGQVVDMIYFDIWEGFLPEWLPIFGGQYYAFWPIFNVADATIFSSVTALLIFNHRWTAQDAVKTDSTLSDSVQTDTK